MKRFILGILAAMTLISCEKIKGEGPILDNDYEISASVSIIHVGSAIKLELSDEYAPGEVKIETYGNIFQYVNFEEDGDKLSVWMDNERYKGDLNVKVYASAAQYSTIVASGAANVSLLEQIPSETYKVVLSGASRFIMSEPSDITKLTINASGASKAKILGSTSQFFVNASGASSIDGEKFTCDDLDVDLSGSSDMSINANKSVTGYASGASILRVGGDADVDVKTSGASTVKPL